MHGIKISIIPEGCFGLTDQYNLLDLRMAISKTAVPVSQEQCYVWVEVVSLDQIRL